ncbi:hypothetical protein HMPREF1549_01475 [Actinomyces johnsonii F0510]|uniref:Uncharacterized protein n=1 Tax=Actinomyces johnsonii F0510 TaxID=1227262 RepID=U1QBA6_9ACTO|nr:hypothetical protein HMPREF1549_01475 [Actinomyces johnsonii F0510]
MRPGGQASQHGHDLGAVGGAQLVVVLARDDVSDRPEAGSLSPSARRSRTRRSRAGLDQWVGSRPG